MSLEDVPRCQHVKVNGVQCGSPALRRRRRCYFHEGVRLERKKFAGDQFAQRSFTIPPLEDANAVQVALMKVIEWLGSGRMEPKMAGLILYALQTAACNLKNTKFEAEKATDVVIDRNTVDQTCINGPQWFARDFTGEVEEGEQGEAAVAGGEEVQAEPDPDKVRANRVRSAKRKWPERAGVEEGPEWTRQIMRSLVPGWEPSVDRVEAG